MTEFITYITYYITYISPTLLIHYITLNQYDSEYITYVTYITYISPTTLLIHHLLHYLYYVYHLLHYFTQISLRAHAKRSQITRGISLQHL
jgi:hypothetical protein